MSVFASANSASGACGSDETRNSGKWSPPEGRCDTSGRPGSSGSLASRSHSGECGRSDSRTAYRINAAQSVTPATGW